MSEAPTYPYEAMFLFPQHQATDLRGAVDHVQNILSRAEAEIISLCKWDERRLAYEIRGNKRGIYFLVYFRARRTAIVGIERDCNLSERILRSIVLRADMVPLERMEAADGRERLEDEIRLRATQPAIPAGVDDTPADGDGDGGDGGERYPQVKVSASALDEATVESET